MKVYDGTTSERTDPPAERVSVGIAEYEVTAEGAVLTTSGLGSCVGVALRDPLAGVAGLVHVMLPTAEGMDGAPAKFADTGIDRLVDAMAASGADPDAIEAKVAGGSDMLDLSDGDSGTGIGARNAAQVRETLAAHDIPVVAADLGGDHGRSLRFEPDGDLVVTSADGSDRRL